ncbi:hypothetical protein ABEW34_23310 [Paenibacillus algorifonticola]|uniref:hypothetical protein n=1 Tax=Paenibacillus algorifonticola TaxID=684063 RepID=UPI003D29B334
MYCRKGEDSINVSPTILSRADGLSFDRMTYPLEMMKVLVLERGYRIFKLIGGTVSQVTEMYWVLVLILKEIHTTNNR